MALIPEEPDLNDGNTPLSEEETDGLLPDHLTTKAELNEFEQANMLEARKWLLSYKIKNGVAESRFLKELHRRMFDQTWAWAGDYRKSEKNLGIDYALISFEIEKLCKEVKFWKEDQFYSPDHIAIKFHHKLVLIHPFPNGNGRHSRLAADLMAVELGQKEFKWGNSNLIKADENRVEYIKALKLVDSNPDQIESLLKFARACSFGM